MGPVRHRLTLESYATDHARCPDLGLAPACLSRGGSDEVSPSSSEPPLSSRPARAAKGLSPPPQQRPSCAKAQPGAKACPHCPHSSTRWPRRCLSMVSESYSGVPSESWCSFRRCVAMAPTCSPVLALSVATRAPHPGMGHLVWDAAAGRGRLVCLVHSRWAVGWGGAPGSGAGAGGRLSAPLERPLGRPARHLPSRPEQGHVSAARVGVGVCCALSVGVLCGLCVVVVVGVKRGLLWGGRRRGEEAGVATLPVLPDCAAVFVLVLFAGRGDSSWAASLSARRFKTLAALPLLSEDSVGDTTASVCSSASAFFWRRPIALGGGERMLRFRDRVNGDCGACVL
jgi:hypothetical protein